MRLALVLIAVVGLLGIGTSVAQAQCCGDGSYTSYYAAPSCSSCSSGCGVSFSSCDSCNSYAPSYSAYYAPSYSSYYTPYYAGYGWGGGFYRTGYWGGGRSCCW